MVPAQRIIDEAAADRAASAQAEVIRIREKIAPMARRRCAAMLDALSLNRAGLASDPPPAI